MPKHSVARILVVDDEPELRELLVDALSSSDMEVSAAASGQEALELASRDKIDFIVTDIRLGDISGLEVLDRINTGPEPIASVVITGHGDSEILAEASRRRPVELMNKPLDIERLRAAIREELARRKSAGKWQHRARRVLRVAHRMNRQRKLANEKFKSTCQELTEAYETMNGQTTFQEALTEYQHQLIGAGNDDEVFRFLFATFAKRSGPLFGISMVCDDHAELHIAGRFGVPEPDVLRFCELLAWPVVETVMLSPACLVMDLSEDVDMFDPAIRKYLAGVTVMAVPLMPKAGEMIGLVILYRKGEQPFTEADVALAQLTAAPTAMAIRRNA